MPDLADGSESNVDASVGSRFRIVTYLSKAVVDDRGDWWLVGIASGPRLDLQNERCSPRALEMMRQAIVSGQIPLRKSHWGDWDEEMGFLREGSIDPAGDLEIRVWLDKDMDYCKTLKRRLDGEPAKGVAPRKLGLSMGGRVTEWFLEPGPTSSQFVRVLDAIELDHVCVTSAPAYPGALIDGLEVKQRQFARRWMSDIAKAVNWYRTADPAPASGSTASTEPEMEVGTGGREVSILSKAEQNPPPSQDVQPPPPPQPEPDETPAEEKAEEDLWKGGRWCGVKAVTETDEVWVKNVQEQQAPSPPPPPAEGEKSMADDQATKALSDKLDTILAKVEEMTKTNETLRAENDALKGERRGLHSDGGGGGNPPPVRNWVEEFKKSDAYVAASPGARQGMLAEALKKAGLAR